jgi:excisionase family DNA binding protein
VNAPRDTATDTTTTLRAPGLLVDARPADTTGVTVAVVLNGVRVPLVLDAAALAALAAALAPAVSPPPSPYLSIVETAAYLRCTRQRVDDLLSSGRLSRVKEGGRTLIARADVERHLAR